MKTRAPRRPLRVGFDLDGVILYNPARVVRPLVALIKKNLLKKKKLKFYVPQSKHERLLWRVFHWSSLFISPGFREIEEMVRRGEIEAYLVTARYSFLEKDFNHWLERSGAKKFFKAWYHNEHDNQPHLYKEDKVRSLNLDVFVEDNLDIVKHLHKTFPDRHVIWIYNVLDRNVDYPHRSPHLKDAIEVIKKKVHGS